VAEARPEAITMANTTVRARVIQNSFTKCVLQVKRKQVGIT
jgi:hypothetical protein